MERNKQQMTQHHSNAPWIRKAEISFKEESKTTGNASVNHARYNTHKWRTASAKYFKGHPCEHPHCLSLAQLTDHRIRIESGGAQWDRRNWKRLCHKHHNIKRGKEAHGYTEEWVETPHGKIPKDRAHLPPDIAGQSYLIK